MTAAQFIDQYTTPVPESGCYLWLKSTMNTGYGQVNFGGRIRLAHRVSWLLEHGSLSDDTCVLHRCDVRSCVNPSHLFLGTRDDNLKDAARKGRTASGDRCTLHREPHRAAHGENHYAAKLSGDDIIKIRADFRRPIEICKDYGVSREAIRDIKARKRWKHI